MAIAAQPRRVAAVKGNPESGGVRAVDFISLDLGIEAGIEFQSVSSSWPCRRR